MEHGAPGRRAGPGTRVDGDGRRDRPGPDGGLCHCFARPASPRSSCWSRRSSGLVSRTRRSAKRSSSSRSRTSGFRARLRSLPRALGLGRTSRRSSSSRSPVELQYELTAGELAAPRAGDPARDRRGGRCASSRSRSTSRSPREAARSRGGRFRRRPTSPSRWACSPCSAGACPRLCACSCSPWRSSTTSSASCSSRSCSRPTSTSAMLALALLAVVAFAILSRMLDTRAAIRSSRRCW